MHSFAIGRTPITLSKDAECKLMSHKWPGNVRELRNVIERAVILETGLEIAAASLPDFSVESRLHKNDNREEHHGIQPGQSFEDAVNEYESRIISEALVENQHNMNKTAEQLQLTRHALRYRMQRLDLLPGNSDGNGGD